MLRAIVAAACIAGATVLPANAQTTSGTALALDAGSGSVERDCSFRVVTGPGGTLTAGAFRVGCVVARIDWPPSDGWMQSYDNLAFDVDVINLTGAETLVAVLEADGAIAGAAVIDTPEPDFVGSFTQRTAWPFPGTSDLTVRYLTTDGLVDAVGDAELEDQGLITTVKVHNVRFWNLSDAVATTAVPVAALQASVDRLNDYVYTTFDDSIDAIYGQCPTETHTQFRFAGLGAMTLNVTPSCVDMTTWNASQSGTCGARYQACINAIFAQAIAADPDLDALHIGLVDNYGSSFCGNNGSGGAHRLVTGYDGSDPDPANHGYMILLEDQSAANPDFLARLLAHEIGHTYLGGHTNMNVSCPGSPNSRNLMCSNTGRLINAGQCTTAMNNTNLRYRDQNQ